MYPYERLNTSKGVIRSREMSLATSERIRAALGKQRVTNYKRITIRKVGEEIQTNTYILIFNQPEILCLLITVTTLYGGVRKPIKKGKYLEKVINNSNLCILNNKSQTYLNPFTFSLFANGSGDQGSITGQVIPKTQKMVLDATLLNTQHYKVKNKGKVEQSRKWSSALLYTLV